MKSYQKVDEYDGTASPDHLFRFYPEEGMRHLICDLTFWQCVCCVTFVVCVTIIAVLTVKARKQPEIQEQ